MRNDTSVSDRLVSEPASFSGVKGKPWAWTRTEIRDYKFITSTEDDLAMYIGYHRMVPVNQARGAVGRILADKPMCPQLEVLMEGF